MKANLMKEVVSLACAKRGFSRNFFICARALSLPHSYFVRTEGQEKDGRNVSDASLTRG